MKLKRKSLERTESLAEAEGASKLCTRGKMMDEGKKDRA